MHVPRTLRRPARRRPVALRTAVVALALVALAAPLLGTLDASAADKRSAAKVPFSHGKQTAGKSDRSGVTAQSGKGKPHTKAKDRFVPPTGVLFNNPLVKSQTRVILGHVIKAIDETNGGQQIFIATWNFDDNPATDALIRAYNRGVAVQVVSSTQVDTADFTRLQRALKAPSAHPGRSVAKSFAIKCKGSCRGQGGIMHDKIYMFSKIHTARDTIMFGSNNLTTAAGNHQWDDMITVSNKMALWKQYITLFRQLRKDKFVKPTPYLNEFTPNKKFHTYAYPLGRSTSPILANLRKVTCGGVTDGYGDGNGHTKIRIAIAGWFDAYGDKIADQVRKLWDQGCDIKVVDTLVGRGVRAELNKTSGRGPIPNREVTLDRNGDGVPEKYTHLKYFTIDGNYRGDTATKIVFTGSCNWSQRSVTSDEILVGVSKGSWVTQYENQVDNLYNLPLAHATGSDGGGGTVDRAIVPIGPLVPATSSNALLAKEAKETLRPGSTNLPSWFELN